MLSFGSYESMTVVGRLGKDAEVKFLADGKPVTRFSIAVDKYNSKDKEKTTAWRDVVSFQENISKQADKLVKGVSVMVVGTPNLRTWKDKEEKDHTSLEIFINDLAVLSGPGKKSEGGESAPAAAPKGNSAPAASAPAPNQIDSDDIPF